MFLSISVNYTYFILYIDVTLHIIIYYFKINIMYKKIKIIIRQVDFVIIKTKL